MIFFRCDARGERRMIVKHHEEEGIKNSFVARCYGHFDILGGGELISDEGGCQDER
jgi:hypothetical protein